MVASGGTTNYLAHIYAANGLYDPNISGVGHQPRGFDQFMLMYDHYVVIASHITCRFTSDDANIPAMECALLLRDNITGLTSKVDYNESPRIRRKVLTNRSNQVVITSKCNPNKFLGRSKPLADPELKGNAGANPVELATWFILVAPATTTSTPTTITVDVNLVYTAVFIEPRQPPQS